MPKHNIIVLVDMDNVLVDFESGLNQQSAEILAEYEGRYDEIPGLFDNMEPYHGAIAAYHQLNEWFDVYICSTAPWENPSAWSAKNLWVKKHLGQVAHKRLILTHHKNMVHGDFLIDDRIKNGVDKFKGVHIHFGQSEFPDWESVIKHFEYLIMVQAHKFNED